MNIAGFLAAQFDGAASFGLQQNNNDSASNESGQAGQQLTFGEFLTPHEGQHESNTHDSVADTQLVPSHLQFDIESRQHENKSVDPSQSGFVDLHKANQFVLAANIAQSTFQLSNTLAEQLETIHAQQQETLLQATTSEFPANSNTTQLANTNTTNPEGVEQRFCRVEAEQNPTG